MQVRSPASYRWQINPRAEYSKRRPRQFDPLFARNVEEICAGSIYTNLDARELASVLSIPRRPRVHSEEASHEAFPFEILE